MYQKSQLLNLAAIDKISKNNAKSAKVLISSETEDLLTDCNGTRTHKHWVRTRKLNCWLFVYEPSGCGFESCYSHLNFRYMPVSSKEFLDIQATIECGFTLKHVREMIRTYSEDLLSAISLKNELHNRNFSKWCPPILE